MAEIEDEAGVTIEDEAGVAIEDEAPGGSTYGSLTPSGGIDKQPNYNRSTQGLI